MKKFVNHPCISQDNNGQLHLKIFQYFYCEMNLPKYQNGFKFTPGASDEEILFSKMDWDSIQDSMAVSASSNDRNNADYINAVKNGLRRKIPFLQKVFNWFYGIDPVEKTFEKIKNSVGILGNDLTQALNNLDKIIKRAELTNQKVLIDRLKEYKNIIASEIILSKRGYDKYVTEGKIIEFFKRCNRGVRIDFIRNYSVLLPLHVIEKKEALDKEGLFDNYVVMHYDPNTIVFQESEEDRIAIRKTDPILFGMIKGSRKLYYIDDWITDEDDLTLDELNIVVENATSRLAKFNDRITELEFSVQDLQNVVDNIDRVDNI